MKAAVCLRPNKAHQKPLSRILVHRISARRQSAATICFRRSRKIVCGFMAIWVARRGLHFWAPALVIKQSGKEIAIDAE